MAAARATQVVRRRKVNRMELVGCLAEEMGLLVSARRRASEGF